VDTHVAATPAVVAPSVSLDLGAVAAPSQDLQIGRRPGWTRLAILLGGSAVLWAGLGWLAFRVLKLG
jgi:hypothetical protein